MSAKYLECRLTTIFILKRFLPKSTVCRFHEKIYLKISSRFFLS